MISWLRNAINMHKIFHLLSRVEIADGRGSDEILASDGVVHPREEPVRARDGDGEALRAPGKSLTAVQLL